MDSSATVILLVRTVLATITMKRQGLLSLLVLLVLSAGCLDGAGSASPTPPSDAQWTDGSSLNTTALAEQHFQRLRESGSFTQNHSETVGVEGAVHPAGARPAGYHPPSFSLELVSLDENRYLGTFVTVGHRRSNHFVTSEVTTRRVKSCPNCSYDYSYQQRPEADTRSQRIDRFRSQETVDQFARFLRGVTVGFNYTYDGTIEQNGELLLRYRAEQTLSTASPPFSEPPHGTATLLVTDAGVVREFQLEYRGNATVTAGGEQRTVSVTHTFVRTYSAIGETAVDRPGWVANARSRDTPRETESGAG